MNTAPVIKTNRLILRTWCDEDLIPFAKMNADPRVMEFFPSVKSFEETAEEMRVLRAGFEAVGYGFWAVSYGNIPFIGFIGLKQVAFQASFTPAVEIGWRLAYDYWGQGLATEGALAALSYGFDTLQLSEIVSFTPTQNIRSQNVMKKIGMLPSPEQNFDHPRLPEGHRLRRHVLYKKAIHIP